MNEALERDRVTTDEHLLELLAEVELLRRKARLIDARLVRWESRLDDACAIVDGLLASADADRDPEARLRSLEGRIERLARRRTAGPAVPGPMFEPAAPAPATPPITSSAPEALAIVFARWFSEGELRRAPVEVGSSVELVADVDGIAPGATVPVEIHPLDSATALTRLDAISDGDRIRARWTIPAACAGRAWCFTARLEGAVSSSSPLYVA